MARWPSIAPILTSVAPDFDFNTDTNLASKIMRIWIRKPAEQFESQNPKQFLEESSRQNIQSWFL
jgi:hypothetical protein